jgi:NADPH2:quinone reductase
MNSIVIKQTIQRKNMKAVMVKRHGGPEVLELTEIPVPDPDAHQVLIHVHAASVNFADINARKGTYRLGQKPPFVPGIDCAGVVAAVGANVRNIEVNQKIIAFPASGSYAEFALAEEKLVFPIPETLSFDLAASFPIVGGTAYHALKAVAGLQPNETALVHAAAGGVGTTALKIAKYLNASRVIGATHSSWKESHIRQMGADAVVNLNAADYEEKINSLTGSRGVDVILNPIGGKTIGIDLKCLAPFGRLVLFGNLAAADNAVTISSLFTFNQSILGFSFGHYRRYRPEDIQDTMRSVIHLVAAGKIEMQIAKRIPLKDVQQAHRLLENQEVIGKLILVND